MSRVLVGVIANDSARYSLFASCVTNLIIPDGGKVEWVIGGDWCGARNTLAQLCLDEGYDYLWFMDDDHAFPPNMLVKLLAHEKKLVTPICLTRQPPFPPVQYTERLEDGTGYLPVPFSATDTEGLVELEAGGCAGMLIHRDVLASIEAPWFEYGDVSEDLLFCQRAKEAGFEIWCDLTCRLGHITTATVYPAVIDGEWVTGLTIGKDLTLTVHTAEQMLKEQEKEAVGSGKPWPWQLRRVLTDEVFVEFFAAPGERIYWQPETPDVAPTGLVQWWVDDGTGFHSVGDPYTYDR